MERGHVKTVLVDRQYGFIRAADDDVYFAARDVSFLLPFDEWLEGREVQFQRQSFPDGRQRAVSVSPAW